MSSGENAMMPPAQRQTAEKNASHTRAQKRACARRSPDSAMAESCQASINTVARMVRMVGIL